MTRSEHVTSVIAAMVVAIGSLTLCGWMFAIPSLKSVFPGLISMKANAAICFILAGLSLLLQSRPHANPAALRRRLAQALALAVSCIGSLVLCEWIFGWDLGIDQLLFRDVPERVVLSAPGRMAPTTALNFTLLGFGLFLLDTPTRRNRWLAQYLTLAVIPITLVAFIGYSYGIGNLHRVSPYASVALHTVVAFLLLSAGILLARPNRGVMALLMGATPGGIMVRRMLLPGIFVTVLFGGLAVLVERAGLYGFVFDIALLVTALVALFVGLMWWAARALDRLELDRRQTQERLRLFIEHAPAAIAMLDTQMRYIAASLRWLSDFGLSGRDFLGHSHYELFPEVPERWKQIHRRCLAGAVERADQDLFERADGTRQWIRWEVRPWYAAPGSVGGIIIFSEEITARKEAEDALRQSEERFRTMADAIPQLAWIARPDGHIFWYNHRCYEYTGATPEQLEGWGWQSLADPRALPRVLAQWRRAIATGQPLDQEFPLRGADGRFRPFLTRVVPLKDTQGQVALWFGTNTDIAELKQTQEELRRLKDELELRVQQRTAELAAANRDLEDFAYIVAHDLKTPLRGVATLAAWLRTDYAPKLDQKGRQWLAQMNQRVGRMNRMIEEILEYSRLGRTEEKREPVALAKLVPLVVHDLAPPPHVRIRIAPGLPVVEGEPVRLRQVFQNLIGNAIKYADKPNVDIAVECADTDSLWEFRVTDNGPGIEEEHFQRIFKMFQTLAPKDRTDSTGVGLALVKRIVEHAGGRVWVESRVGEGSTFHFTWPKGEAGKGRDWEPGRRGDGERMAA